MKEQNADYRAAGNCNTCWSLNGQIDMVLKLANDAITTNIVKFYSSDTDVFQIQM